MGEDASVISLTVRAQRARRVGSARAAPLEPPPFSAQSLRMILRHADFRPTVEALSATALAYYDGLDEVTRWFRKDLGREALYAACVILDGMPGGLSVARLAASASLSRACSRGRVLAFVQRAHVSGRLMVPRGSEPWTQRRLILTPAFVAPLREQLKAMMRASLPLAPELRGALDLLPSQRRLHAAFMEAGRVAQGVAGLGGAPNDAVDLVLKRYSGMLVLHHWISLQRPGRARLLEAAPLLRTETARRFNISRAHLNALIDDLAAAGLMSVVSADRIEFSEAFSQGVEAYFALYVQGLRLVGRAVMAAAT